MKFYIKLLALFTIGIVTMPHSVYAQDQLLMMNGSLIYVSIEDTSGGIIRVLDPDSKKKEVVVMERERIFSLRYRTGQEVVLYRQDTTSEDNFYTTEEMRSFISGEHDANNRYSSPGAFWGSFGLGLVSGYFIPAWLSPLGAGAGAFLLGSNWIKINREHVSDQKFLKDPVYIKGYETTARNRRVQNVIKGAVVGLVIGAVMRYTIK